MPRLRFPSSASVFVRILTPVMLLAAAPAARADIPPTCDQEASLITCAAADVGKPCQGAGQCYAVSCSATTPPTTATTLYKCDACPTVVTNSTVTCSTTNIGTDCGTGATCMVLSGWCAGAAGKFVCATPAPAQPTGPPTGGGSSSSGNGACTIGAGNETTAGIAGGLVMIGLGFLSLSRRRRSR